MVPDVRRKWRQQFWRKCVIKRDVSQVRRGLNDSSRLCLGLVVFLVMVATGEAQTQIFPQLTDGGDWRMALLLENTTASATAASLSFFQDTTNGATTSWNPPFLETSNTQSLQIPAGGTVYLHTPGTAATLSQGWGQLTGAGVVGFVIYTYESYAGRPDQDGTSQATTAASRILVPFDCTTGFATGFAIVNPTGAAETISVNIETDDGTVTQTSLPSLPPNGQIAVVTATQFPVTVGHRGMAEFYVSSGGSVSIAAFRFNPTLALTSLPVFPQTGAPIIGGGSSGGGTLPKLISITATPVPDPLQIGQDLQIQIYGELPDGSYSVGSVDGFGGAGTTASPTLSYSAEFTSITASGLTLTFNGLNVAGSAMGPLGSGNTANIASASVTVTLSPGAVVTSGTVSGTVNLVSTLGTVNQTFTGTYSGN
jgi:hypothetical protein